MGVLTGVGYGVVDCGTAEHNSLGCNPARFYFWAEKRETTIWTMLYTIIYYKEYLIGRVLETKLSFI
ncbi:hypothetical protein VN97_g7746 [Penicillium thymicola]|uniref:Uncharacterized protein n=1 Tax=Penicillium thymicola TaxID=293382 RepID=A0AAI9TF18_PENTH|nr:hypothetical protein VN97_g7746 [Penicillium thymicola]